MVGLYRQQAPIFDGWPLRYTVKGPVGCRVDFRLVWMRPCRASIRSADADSNGAGAFKEKGGAGAVPAPPIPGPVENGLLGDEAHVPVCFTRVGSVVNRYGQAFNAVHIGVLEDLVGD